MFLSLGWNFFEFGLNPLGEESGVSGSWIFCGVLFALMGAAPLLFLINRDAFRAVFASDGASLSPAMTRLTPGRSSRGAAGKVVARVDTGDEGGQSDDLVHALERMAALHTSGALTDDEFAAAKRRLLGITDDSGNDEGGEAR